MSTTAVIYCRVSTSDKGQNTEVQADELRRFCKERMWAVHEEVIDHGYSGGTDQRPGLKRLLELARSGQVGIVVVTKMDRLARSLKHLVGLLDEFAALGIQFVSVKDQIDMTTAAGRLMIHVVGAFAEFERALVRERTISGLEHARRQGKRLGRPKPIHNVALMLHLRAQGLPLREIARLVGVSHSTVGRELKAAGTELLAG